MIITLPETNMVHLKMTPWKFGDSELEKPSFSGAMLVLGRVPHNKVRPVSTLFHFHSREAMAPRHWDPNR